MFESMSPSVRAARRPFFVRALILCAFTLATIAACHSNNDEVALAGLQSSCSLNSDCTAPLVCAFRACHVECTPEDGGGSRDCPNNERCLASDRPFYVCQNPDETSCTYNSDCPSPLVCGRDLICRDECQVTSDCQSGQLCVTGTCANISELVDGSLPAPAVGVDASTSQANPSCSYNTDCTAPQVCRTNGYCGLECKGDRDCAAGQTCTANLCVVPPIDASVVDAYVADTYVAEAVDANDATLLDVSTIDAVDANTITIPDGAPDGYGGACNFTSDCAIGLICNRQGACTYECLVTSDCDVAHGYCCSAYHTCLTGSICTSGSDASINSGADASRDGSTACVNDSNCQDGIFCNGVERCISGKCTAATTTACDDADPCTADTCTEATQSCTHTSTGPVDQDHDGYYASSCGGNDCDDTNPDVNPGHAEVCDFIDNNCNGEIDEGAWTDGAVTTFGAGQEGYQGSLPLFMRLGDGTFLAVRASSNYGGSGNGYAVAYKLSSTLVPSAGVQVTPSGNYYSEYPSVATDGTTLAFGVDQLSNQAVTYGFAASDLSHVSTGTIITGGATGAPSVLWIPSQSKFAAIWSDNHLPAANGYATLYAGWIAPSADDAGVAQNATNIHQLLATQSDCVNTNSPYYVQGRVWAAAGTSSVFVAWYQASTGHMRWVVMDPTITSVYAGPFDTTQADSTFGQQAYFDGTNYVFLTVDPGGANAHIRVLDAMLGTVVQESTVAAPSNGSQFQIATYHSGYLLTYNYGTTILFGWTPSLATPFTFNQIGSYGSGITPSAAALAPIDSTHVALLYEDTTNTQLATMTMTCGN